MYCPINNPENGCGKTHPCCRLYNLTLAILAAIILFVIGLIFGTRFAEELSTYIPLLGAVAAILFVIFIVTLLTRGCCNRIQEE